MIGIKNIVRCLTVCVAGVVCLPWALAQEAARTSELPSAESILDRFVEATGGAEAYAARESLVATGTMEIRAAGLTGKIELYAKRGKRYMRREIPGVGVLESGVNDGIVWESSMMLGTRIVTGPEAGPMLRESDLDAAVDWRDYFPEVETVGIEEIDGEAVYRVVQTPMDADEITNFFSVESGLLLATEFTLTSILGPVPVRQVVQEYSDVGGVSMPTKTLVDSAGTLVVVTYASSEANVEIPDARFDLPEAVQALLE